ncbi:Uncharacterised protein [Mycobacteroides abscessus subsp. abscessus]|nr:Uncharacterised protein [Mycobacteroides abscessus subsp. abscessus]SIJ09454.1 Uncharacterised protein [Mycobacteroides abscessus subsp. abscessus]
MLAGDDAVVASAVLARRSGCAGFLVSGACPAGSLATVTPCVSLIETDWLPRFSVTSPPVTSRVAPEGVVTLVVVAVPAAALPGDWGTCFSGCWGVVSVWLSMVATMFLPSETVVVLPSLVSVVPGLSLTCSGERWADWLDLR